MKNNTNTIYLVTGAAGHLGTNITLQLLERKDAVRAFVLPNDPTSKYIPKEVEICEGDLCNAESVERFLTVPDGMNSVVIHCASMVTVNPDFNQKVMDINVGGTKNIINACAKHSECKNLVYVSSTGAIPELPKGQKIKEVYEFDPDKVVGCYSQSKALATQAVLDAVKNLELNACVVHPSGILGPNDHGASETTAVLTQIINGEMPAGIKGSFNLCDVRDLANGCILAADKGVAGQCYILGNGVITLKEVCDLLVEETGCKKLPFYLPLGIANFAAGILEKQAKKSGKRPLMTTFSVYNLARNNEFDYSKAVNELGYHVRSYRETMRDEVAWLAAEGKIKVNKLGGVKSIDTQRNTAVWEKPRRRQEGFIMNDRMNLKKKARNPRSPAKKKVLAAVTAVIVVALIVGGIKIYPIAANSITAVQAYTTDLSDQIRGNLAMIPNGNEELNAVVYQPNDGEVHPLVIVSHGFLVSHKDPLIITIAEHLRNQGMSVITFDFNGHGDSYGEIVDMTISKEVSDLAAVVDYAKTLDNVSDIYLVGHSQGGLVTSLYAGEHPDSVEGIVLLSLAANAHDQTVSGRLLTERFDAENPPEYVELNGWFKIGKGYITDVQNMDVYNTAKNYKGDVLLLWGSLDIIVPKSVVEAYDDIYENAAYSKVDGASHTYMQKLDEVAEMVTGFIKDADIS